MRVRGARYQAMIGTKHGTLTVQAVRQDPERPLRTQLVCQCDCGRQIFRIPWNLTDRATCGECGPRKWGRRSVKKGGADWTDEVYKEKLFANCKVMPDGCWIWQGTTGKAPRNYGHTSYRGKGCRTHRLAWQLTCGEIPNGMVVMHSCDTPPCCNPAHLKLGTHLENMAECRAKDRYHYANLTHCKHGHEFNEQNTYIIPTPGKFFGLRACKRCQIAAMRIKHGWPRDLAYSTPPLKRGYVPPEVREYRRAHKVT